jgi:hypothetical protein
MKNENKNEKHDKAECQGMNNTMLAYNDYEDASKDSVFL